MKKLLVLSLLMAVGCERPTTPTSSPPSSPPTITPGPRPQTDAELLEVELAATVRPAPPKPAPVVVRPPVTVTTLKPVEPTPPPLSPENEEAVKLAGLRIQALNARVALQQQEALLEYIDVLEADFLHHWKPDGAETGSSVIAHMRTVARFRNELLKERDILRQRLATAEQAVLRAEQEKNRRVTASK